MAFPKKYYLILPGLLLLFLIGGLTRHYVLLRQYKSFGGELPFTLESALEYRMVKSVVDTGTLAKRETKVQWPEGVTTRETYSIGAEYVYGYIARSLPGHISLPHRIRLASIWVFALAIPALALYTGLRFRSVVAGGVAGLYYAIAISGVIRSNGLELSRENLGIPLFLFFLAATALCELKLGKKVWWSCALFAASSLALAVCNWDMIQYGIYLWLMVQVVKVIRKKPATARERWLPTLVFTGLLFAGMLNPYLRSHGFLVSPLLGIFAGLMLMLWAPGQWFEGRRSLLRWLLPVLPLLVLMLIPHGYEENYQHFSSLLKAKILFLNQKPADPSLLTYTQRIMWTPQLDSATWRFTFMMFKFSLYLGFTSAAFILFYKERLRHSIAPDLVFYFLISTLAFVFFVRFQVYVAPFMAMCIGGGVALALRVPVNAVRYGVVVMVLWLGFWPEWDGIVNGPGKDPKTKQERYWGRIPSQGYINTKELVDWLKDYAPPERDQPRAAVLANFNLSGTILGYTECPIILHPKFETPGIRARVQDYGEHLFTKSEKEFRAWALKHKARYLVFSKGEFAKTQQKNQMRYMVNALKPKPDAAAMILKDPLKTIYFQKRWDNRQYLVYEILSDEDERESNELAITGEVFYGRGDLEQADKFSGFALVFWPQSPRALDLKLNIAKEIFRNNYKEPSAKEPSAPKLEE